MSKRVLMIASMGSMLDHFNRDAVDILEEMGYTVDLAANFETEDGRPPERNAAFRAEMEEKGRHTEQVGFTRRPFALLKHWRAYAQIKRLLSARGYDMVHCHSPISAALTRLACRKARKKGLKVIYTAHGFHFFRGAPKKNWLLYYPMERICARMTDVLIVMNREDEGLAKRKMRARRVAFIHGMGVDAEKIALGASGAERGKVFPGVSEGDKILLSVGELNANKNHETVVRALAAMENPAVRYYIAGEGEGRERLESVIRETGMEERVTLLGFRRDVAALCGAADVFVFPSFREGLSVAMLEAMASGLPAVCSRIRGNTDLIEENKGGFLFDPYQSEDARRALEKMLASPDRDKMGAFNREKVKLFGKERVREELKAIYNDAAGM